MSQDVTVRDSVKAGKVTIRQSPPVVTRRDRVKVVETSVEDTIVILDQQQHKVLISSIGVQGPPGPPGSGGGGTAAKFAADVGDGVASDYVITHNLNMTDCEVEVFRKASPFDRIFPDVEHTSVNTITLRFSPVPVVNQFRVVVLG